MIKCTIWSLALLFVVMAIVWLQSTQTSKLVGSIGNATGSKLSTARALEVMKTKCNLIFRPSKSQIFTNRLPSDWRSVQSLVSRNSIQQLDVPKLQLNRLFEQLLIVDIVKYKPISARKVITVPKESIIFYTKIRHIFGITQPYLNLKRRENV